MADTALPRSYTHVYWGVWLVALAVLVISKFTWLKNADKDTGLLEAFMVYAIGTGLVAIFAFAFERHRLLNYLEKHHNVGWREISNVSGKLPSEVESRVAFLFLYHANDFGDPAIAKQKEHTKHATFFVIPVFFSIALGYVPFIEL